MKLLNTIEAFYADNATSTETETQAGTAEAMREAFSILLRALYPVCPHITHALWQELGFEKHMGELVFAPWPMLDEAALVQDEIELVVQVNGKLRGSITVAKNADKATIEAAALANESVARFIETPPKKIIIVKDKLVSIVV
jgi:leucyl-tRNA synthetase